LILPLPQVLRLGGTTLQCIFKAAIVTRVNGAWSWGKKKVALQKKHGATNKAVRTWAPVRGIALSIIHPVTIVSHSFRA
jgi:hypothetical protein